ncbi:MAG: Pyridine nucleotide-disulfide oxidoreductase, FAD/NAD(P)-binding domain protein, partial [Betaproteobacteria bacterium]|nr:Pyridine nucleotide-disulfide oxidoreductase, FAD/NAD(P)-binding domain protein [Betaproteobacteria bacterium]
TPNITLLTHTELEAVMGGEMLESVRWKKTLTGEQTVRPVRHVFVFIGALPCTDFLDASVVRDAKGYIKTGPALVDGDLERYTATGASRQPQFLETSWPNLFAVGDVRAGSLKRVASAVGEGAAVVTLVHQALNA